LLNNNTELSDNNEIISFEHIFHIKYKLKLFSVDLFRGSSMKYQILCFVMIINIDVMSGQNKLNEQQQQDLAVIFTNIYNHNLWAGKESVSGKGSDLTATGNVRNHLPIIFKTLDIKTILDAPCGDFWWMRKVDFSKIDSYIGIDIVQKMIDKNNKLYGKSNIHFMCKNLVTAEDLPRVDLIICRDLFNHLPFAEIKTILTNFKRSGSQYILLSTYAKTKKNRDRKVVNTYGRHVNFQLPPFNFPKPLLLIDEQYKNKPVKYCGLWQIESLPI
jgi:hypothetical protein